MHTYVHTHIFFVCIYIYIYRVRDREREDLGAQVLALGRRDQEPSGCLEDGDANGRT